MTKGYKNYIMFESDEQVMFASLKYQQLPPFCNQCNIVGHSLDSCQTIRKGGEEDMPIVNKPSGRIQKVSKKRKPGSRRSRPIWWIKWQVEKT